MKLPITIKRLAESYQVQDAQGRSIYLYFEDDATRRSIMHRWTSAEAEAVAKKIARFLTDDAERAGQPPKEPAG